MLSGINSLTFVLIKIYIALSGSQRHLALGNFMLMKGQPKREIRILGAAVETS